MCLNTTGGTLLKLTWPCQGERVLINDSVQEGASREVCFLPDTISGLLGRRASLGEVPGEAHTGIFQAYALIILMRKKC